MYSMWEVHQLVTERQAILLHETQRVSLRRLFEEVPIQEREALIDAVLLSEAEAQYQPAAISQHDANRWSGGNRWAWLAALLERCHVYP
jgi:hypothetical protein